MLRNKSTTQTPATAPGNGPDAVRQNQASYSVAVVVKNTGIDGPGHVSTLLHKQKGDKSRVKHTSFFPAVSGSILNALSFGSIPVTGVLEADPIQDIREADHIVTSEISHQDYKAGREAQKELEKQVASGHCYYSIFANLNPLAAVSGSLINAYKSSELTARQHYNKYGFYPPEDAAGIPVYSNKDHTHSPTPIIHNCVTSSEKVLNATNISFDTSPVIPTQFGILLQTQHGFEAVEKSDILNRFNRYS